LPRNLGMYENKNVTIGAGRFGPYISHDGKFTSLKKGEDDPLEVTLERAIQLIEEKRELDNKKIIKSFKEHELMVLNGRWGPYISYKGNNFKIPKTVDASALSLEETLKLVSSEGKEKTTKVKEIKDKKPTSTVKSKITKGKSKSTKPLKVKS